MPEHVSVKAGRLDRVITRIAAALAICASVAIIMVSVRMFAVLRAPAGAQANSRYVLDNRPEPIADMDAVEISIPEVSGRASGSIVLIEFSDYECPYCRWHAQQTLSRIRTSFVKSEAVKYVFRNFPLEFHPLAMKAALAAECAGDQGKFWDMHDHLFASDAHLDESSLLVGARAIGLREPAFSRCVAGSKGEKIRADRAEGARLGVRATPTFFLGWLEPNGNVKIVRRIEGAQPFSTFETAIERTRRETASPANSHKS